MEVRQCPNCEAVNEPDVWTCYCCGNTLGVDSITMRSDIDEGYIQFIQQYRHEDDETKRQEMVAEISNQYGKNAEVRRFIAWTSEGDPNHQSAITARRMKVEQSGSSSYPVDPSAMDNVKNGQAPHSFRKGWLDFILDMFSFQSPSHGIGNFVFLRLFAPFRLLLTHLRSQRHQESMEAARKVAQENGIDIIEVEREIYRTYIGQPNLPTAKVAAYCLRHRSPKNTHWLFLHRKPKKTAEYPGRHSPFFVSGRLTPDLDALFWRLAEEELFQSVFIEVESTPNEVRIYWDESGGELAARRVIEVLFEISHISN